MMALWIAAGVVTTSSPVLMPAKFSRLRMCHYMNKYKSISPPAPCLSRATKLRRVLLLSACPKSFHHFNHELRVKFTIYFHSSPALQSAIGCLPVCDLLLAVCYLLLPSCIDPTDKRVTLPLVFALNLGRRRKPSKNH